MLQCSEYEYEAVLNKLLCASGFTTVFILNGSFTQSESDVSQMESNRLYKDHSHQVKAKAISLKWGTKPF